MMINSKIQGTEGGGGHQVVHYADILKGNRYNGSFII